MQDQVVPETSLLLPPRSSRASLISYRLTLFCYVVLLSHLPIQHIQLTPHSWGEAELLWSTVLPHPLTTALLVGEGLNPHLSVNCSPCQFEVQRLSSLMKSNFNDFVFLPNNENLSTYLIGGKKKIMNWNSLVTRRIKHWVCFSLKNYCITKHVVQHVNSCVHLMLSICALDYTIQITVALRILITCSSNAYLKVYCF